MDAPSIPWRKDWRLRDSTPPRVPTSRGLARKSYHDAYLAHGASHPATRAAWARLVAVNGEQVRLPVGSEEAVAFARATGDHGHWNRGRRRELDRRMKKLLGDGKPESGERVLLAEAPR